MNPSYQYCQTTFIFYQHTSTLAQALAHPSNTMAETAGLVIGGIGLAGLFDICMNTFARLDAGKNCSKDYQESALHIALLGARLRRWEEVYKESATNSDVKDGEMAKSALESINSKLERMCKTAEKYQEQPSGDDGVANLTNRVQTLSLRKVKVSFGRKIVWALHEKERVAKITESVLFEIEELESIAASLKPDLQKQAQRDAGELMKTDAEKSDPNVQVLEGVAKKVDPVFYEAVLTKTTGHRYARIETADTAKALQGDHVDENYKGQIMSSSNTYEDIKTLGNARAHNGNKYGGTYVLDD